MELLEAIRSRRAVKHFDPNHKLSEAEIRHLLDHAMLAPTSFNMQNWHFVVVTDQGVQDQLCVAAWNQAQVKECSVTVVLAGALKGWENMERQLRHAPDDVKKMFTGMVPGFYGSSDQLERDEAVRSISFAGQNLMLVARQMGLDSCPMIGFDSAKVSEALGLDENHPPLLMLTIGKAKEEARPRMGLLSYEECVSVDRFGNHALSGEPDES
jgi:nitroreductase